MTYRQICRNCVLTESWDGWLLLPSWNLLLSPVFCCPSTISGSWPSTMCLFLQIPDLISPLLCSFHICADVSYLYNSFIIYFYALILSFFFTLENVSEFLTMLSLMRFINQSSTSPNLLDCIFCENSSLFFFSMPKQPKVLLHVWQIDICLISKWMN